MAVSISDQKCVSYGCPPQDYENTT